jgi:RNA polymerase sigma factor (sigma-70 family)
MAAGQLRALLQHLRRIVGPQWGGLTDAHLLERFVDEQDEAAFEVLVWRHGPMVLSVCRRILRHEQDAEDAFQATFLTFVRKAHSIGKRQAVAAWLYKVAYRIALEAKALASRRRTHEKQETGMLEATAKQPAPESTVWGDLRTVLDEEVNRLPEKYRTPLILCYFQGKTYEEAARELGCPKGTVSIRLMRARELLRPRLARRGLALSGGMLAAVLSENATAVAISQSLADGTIQAARLFAAGKVAGVLSGQVVALAEGVLKTMFMTKLKIVGAVLLAVGVAGSVAGVLTYSGVAGEQKEQKAEKLPTPAAVELQEKAVKPTQPTSQSRKEKQKATVAKPDMEGKRKPSPLEAARHDLQRDEARYEVSERNWMQEMVDARLRVMEAEDKLRKIEDKEDSESGVYSQLKAAQDQLRDSEPIFRSKDYQQLKQMREKVRELEKQWNQIEGAHTAVLYRARRDFLEAEENLRLLERTQDFQRDRARRKLEAANERVRQLEQDSSPAAPAKSGTAQLESKVDRLLREMGELRREIRRLQTEKSQPQLPRGRPDQP